MIDQTKSPPPDFRRACIEYFKCPLEAYEDTLFWHALHDHAVGPARLIRRRFPDYFNWDVALIRTLAQATTPAEVQNEINTFRSTHRMGGFLRRTLRIRISGQKLLDLSSQLLPK